MFRFSTISNKLERENKMTNIQKVGWDFAKMAAKRQQKLMSVPLNDKSVAKILWNDNSVDCFVMKNGKMIEGRGAQGNPDFITNELAKVLDRVRESAVPGFDMLMSFVKASK